MTVCAACDGRGWIARPTGYLHTVTGGRYKGGVARDFCFDCHGTGTVPPAPGSSAATPTGTNT